MSDNTGSANTPAPALTREDWLRRAVEEVRPMFATQLGMTIPEKIHVSVGFGNGGGRYESGNVLGVCWHSSHSADGGNHIFVSPTVGDTMEVVLVLLHELIHAADDNASGHRGDFVKAAKILGFESPFTELHAGIVLQAVAMEIAAALGEYPHAVLSPVRIAAPVPTGDDDGGVITIPGRPNSGPPAQRNRHLAVTCPTHGGSVRISRKRYEAGAPLCGVNVLSDEGVSVCTLRMDWKVEGEEAGEE